MPERYYDIHGFVGVSVDEDLRPEILESVEFQIGYFSTNSRPKNISLTIRPYSARPSVQEVTYFHKYSGISENYIEHSTREFAVEVSNGKFTAYTSDAGFLINIYIQLILSEAGMSFIHAAGLAKDDTALLLAGGGGVGKTALASNLVQNSSYRWLGDDLIILGENGDSLSFPRSFVLKEYHQGVYPEYFEEHNLKRKSTTTKWQAKVVRFLYANAPFVGITESLLQRLGVYQDAYSNIGRAINDRYVATPPMEDLFGDDLITDSSQTGTVIFMERYEGMEFEFKEISADSMADRLAAVIHHEWVDYMREFFTLGSLELFEFTSYFENVLQIIASGLSSNRCCIFRIPGESSPQDVFEAFREIESDI
ncbi:hypothetical protein [Halosegnis rubeus]|uniref:HPr kinase n=1 Tax=Halosegnis rubeus TaxID=2212850 RepID=A0A5N5UKU7_9EURY|nr:hypothetical protein [Halosegnis rubeus]KAB7519441.1 hypothetical protein DP108_04885 [Halosegnis rubeus]